MANSQRVTVIGEPSESSVYAGLEVQAYVEGRRTWIDGAALRRLILGGSTVVVAP